MIDILPAEQRTGMFANGGRWSRAVRLGKATGPEAQIATRQGLARWMENPAALSPTLGASALRLQAIAARPPAPGPAQSAGSRPNYMRSKLPDQVTFPDHPCDDVPITKDPMAQRRMLGALAASIRPGLSSGVEETGFWGADRLLGGYDYSDDFTDHQQSQIDVAARQRGLIEALLNASTRDRYYFHTHPVGLEPSPIDGTDRDVARSTNSIGIAIDSGGRVTCVR